jgi:choline dehydrogenase-like flavoprotein
MGVEDWLRLESAMKLSARALFEMGATEIFTTRFDAKSLARGGSIERYFEGTGPLDYLKVQTAHLHGGNVIHEDPRQGVVDSECKVYGFQNLWICDGSVIPAAITLNLQLTIMAMARYAADSITADRVSRSLVASVQE